jgi:hypothetical protein
MSQIMNQTTTDKSPKVSHKRIKVRNMFLEIIPKPMATNIKEAIEDKPVIDNRVSVINRA